MGAVDRWVANTVLYDLVGYFRRERAIRSPSALAPIDAFDEFHELAAAVLDRVGSEAVRSFDILPVEFAVRRATAGARRRLEYVPVPGSDGSGPTGSHCRRASRLYTGRLGQGKFRAVGLSSFRIYPC